MSESPSLVPATIYYGIRPTHGVRAYQNVNTNPKTGLRDRNWTLEGKEVLVENVRGKEDIVTLDTAGFQFYDRPARHKSFANDEEIRREYYPESEQLLKELTGASRVIIFDHSELSFESGLERI